MQAFYSLKVPKLNVKNVIINWKLWQLNCIFYVILKNNNKNLHKCFIFGKLHYLKSLYDLLTNKR